jgi:hypothetical protein
VTFFNARSDEESGSPSTTKFRAFTLGQNLLSNSTPHINFDSQIQYHYAQNTDLYHFRAYSAVDSKTTFWVKPGTAPSGVSTADMYLSGKFSVGPSLPFGHAVDIQGVPSLNGPVRELLGIYDSSSYGAGVGGAIVFSGKFNSSGATAGNFAAIQGVKENSNDGDYASAMSFFTRANGGNPQEQLRIASTGNVGIGTTPAANSKLDVNGAATVRGNLTVNGSITATGSIYATYQDVAEWVPATEAMAAGTVVVVAEEGDNTVTASTHAYDTTVAGVVSPNPGLLLGVASASKAKIATTGRVRVRVDATKSPIRKGDLLVTSDRPGMAMKSEPLDFGGVKLHRPGTLIGKALEPLAGGQDEILVLLSLQ